jgi:methylmalonyl-CoA mutase N-terminal domain/subunit
VTPGGATSWSTHQRDEAEAYEYFRKIEDIGGVIPALESGYLQREIADASFQYQREIDHHDRTIVGVNEYVMDEPIEIPILDMDPEGEAPGRAPTGTAKDAMDGKPPGAWERSPPPAGTAGT